MNLKYATYLAPQHWSCRDLSFPLPGLYTPACMHFWSSDSLYCTLAFVSGISQSQLENRWIKEEELLLWESPQVYKSDNTFSIKAKKKREIVCSATENICVLYDMTRFSGRVFALKFVYLVLFGIIFSALHHHMMMCTDTDIFSHFDILY